MGRGSETQLQVGQFFLMIYLSALMVNDNAHRMLFAGASIRRVDVQNAAEEGGGRWPAVAMSHHSYY